jgi:hypothetical protein
MPAFLLRATFPPCLTDGALAQSGTARRILPLRFFCEPRDRMYVGVPAKGHDPAQVWAYEAED